MSLSINLFLKKWLFHIYHSFILFFMISSSCFYVWFCVVLLQCFVFHCLAAAFYLCVGNSGEENKFDKIETINHIMVICMLQNRSHRYSSYYSIFKIINFNMIYYTINLGVSSYMNFNEFLCISIGGLLV